MDKYDILIDDFDMLIECWNAFIDHKHEKYNDYKYDEYYSGIISDLNAAIAHIKYLKGIEGEKTYA